MSYSGNPVWNAGDVITPEKMNNIEAAITKHDSQDVVITRSEGRVVSVVLWKPSTAGVKRVETLLNYDAAGTVSNIDERTYAPDGVTVMSRAITTFVRDSVTGQILRAEVRPA